MLIAEHEAEEGSPRKSIAMKGAKEAGKLPEPGYLKVSGGQSQP